MFILNCSYFEALNGLKLNVTNRKSAVIFELDQSQTEGKYQFELEFSQEKFQEFLNHIKSVSNDSWKGLVPKKADSMGADYWEYYDRELDNNGYLSLNNNTLKIERPSLESGKLYQFNKKKMESFIFDCDELTNLKKEE